MSSQSPRLPVVRVLFAGAALTVASGCSKDVPPTSAPETPDAPEAPEAGTDGAGPVGAPGGQPTMNPPPPDPTETATLPTWEAVQSNHPEGATNPPMPVLVVNEAGDSCHKAWFDPRAVPQEAREKGGIVLDEGEEATGTAVQCPPDQVAEVLGRHAEVEGAAGEGAQEGAEGTGD